MQVGDVTPMTACTVIHEGNGQKVSLSYRAAKKEKLYFLFLGSSSNTAPLDPVAVLTAMGWTPSEELVKILDEHEKLVY